MCRLKSGRKNLQARVQSYNLTFAESFIKGKKTSRRESSVLGAVEVTGDGT